MCESHCAQRNKRNAELMDGKTDVAKEGESTGYAEGEARGCDAEGRRARKTDLPVCFIFRKCPASPARRWR